MRTGDNEREDRSDLQDHHRVIGFCGFANAAHQHHGENHHDEECGDVEAEVKARCIEQFAL